MCIRDSIYIYGETLGSLRDKLSKWEFLDLLAPEDSNFFDHFESGDGRTFLLKSPRGLQGMVTSLSEAHVLKAFLKTLSPGDRARMNSASQKFASLWLMSSASNTKLENLHFVKSVLLRLGTPGESNSNPASALSNPGIASTTKGLRHKFLTNGIARWALRAGAECAKTEAEHLWPDDNTRPDIDMILGDKRLLVDVAVVHPTAPSYTTKPAGWIC